MGLEVAPAKSILVPTAHDEPAIRLGIFKEVFQRAAALCYLTESEQKFVRGYFHDRPLIEEVVGVGVDLPQQAPPYPRLQTSADEDRPRHKRAEPTRQPRTARPTRGFPSHLMARGAMFRRRHRLHGSIVLYGGRIDPGKGLRGADSLLQRIREGRRRRDAGADGRQAHGAARGSVHPVRRPPDGSGTVAGPGSGDRRRLPVTLRELVAAGARGARCRDAGAGQRASAVLVEHCVRSNGGLYYADRDEFVECLKLLIGDERLRAGLGRNGREYIRRNYRWDVVLGKYDRIFARVRNR
jgi:hypothetical protein